MSLGWKPGEGSGMDVSSDCVLSRRRPPGAAAPCRPPAPPRCLCPGSFYSVPPPAAGPRPGRAATRIHATGMHSVPMKLLRDPSMRVLQTFLRQKKLTLRSHPPHTSPRGSSGPSLGDGRSGASSRPLLAKSEEQDFPGRGRVRAQRQQAGSTCRPASAEAQLPRPR